MNTFVKKSGNTAATPKEGMYNQTSGQPILQNHIIVNINENKNINNYYRVVGRKMDEEPNIIRMGARNTDDTNSQDLLAKFSADLLFDNPSKSKGSKTLISKKLLLKAKQANTKKTSRGIGKQDLNKTSVPISSNLLGNHQSYQTARNERKKQKSQFDINVRQRSKNATSITLDYDKPSHIGILNQSTSGVRSAILGQKASQDVSARRKSANSNLLTSQGKNTQRQKSQIKSSRPLAQAKQNHNFTRQKKSKSDGRSRYKLNQMAKTQGEGKHVDFEDEAENGDDSSQPLLHENIMLAHSQNHSDTRIGSQRHNSLSVQSVPRSKQKAQTKLRKNENGVSLSSGFSSASGKGYHNNSASFRHQGSESIVQQLNKTYFLNTKQLLKHLSPSKDHKSEKNDADTANLDQPPPRGRSKSLSTTSRTRGQHKSKEKHQTMPSRQDTEQRFNKSKSATLGTAAPAPPPTTNQSIPQPTTLMNKHLKNLDKLIKENIRKNQSKIEEQQLRQQLEDYKIQQRKNNLSQRNKELRHINASKVVPTQKESIMVPPAENKSSLAMKSQNNRKRSQSCAEYKSFKNKTTIDSDHRPARSQGKSDERASVQDNSKLTTQNDFKVVPNTTTNQNQSSVRQRSFVDEITKLTQQVEKELGLARSNQQSRTQGNQMTMHSKMFGKPNQKLNETGESAIDRTQLASYLLQKSDKPTKKKAGKMSVKVQRFIEKKKREEIVKKSLEQTIEAEKQEKIKQNLINLDKYVQKHIRQKSQPNAVVNKKQQILANSLLQVPGEKKLKHKKNKKTQDIPEVGLSEIFYRHYGNKSNSDIHDDPSRSPDKLAVHISPGKFASLHASIQDYPDQNASVVSTAGRSQKAKKTRSSKSRKTQLKQDRIKDTSLIERTGSGSGMSGVVRKSNLKNQPPLLLNPNKQQSIPLPQNNDSLITNNSNPQLNLKSKNQLFEKSKWLKQKHPDQQLTKSNPTCFSSEIQTQSDFNQTTPLILGQLKSSKQERKHKSSGKIRRIHELVALYRCKFKPNVSDASIIGTLHSAASVIQIHFRYRKHLREANSMVLKNNNIKNNTTIQQSAKNHNSKQSTVKQTSYKQKNDNFSILGLEKILNDEETTFKEVRGSVFNELEDEDNYSHGKKVRGIIGETNHYEQKKENSPKELQFKRQKVNPVVPTKAQAQKDPSEKASRDIRKPEQKLQLMLDIHQIVNENERDSAKSYKRKEDNPQLVGGNKTPQIPGLNLDRLNFQPEQQNEVKLVKNDNPYREEVENKEINDSESQKTVTSYRGLFNRIGLPLSRSARVKIDYDLMQKDPKIKEQLRQIVHFKEVQGKQVLIEGRQQNIISDKTFQVNIKKLEKWVNSSYMKINELEKEHHKTKVRTKQELIQEHADGRDRLQKLISGNIDGDSANHSHMSQSWRAHAPKQTESNSQYQSYLQLQKDDAYSERDPYNHHQTSKQHMPLGSGRREQSKLIELIQGETSRTSHIVQNLQSSSESKKDFAKPQEDHELEEVSIKLEDIQLENLEVPTYIINDRSRSNLGIHGYTEELHLKNNQRLVDPEDIEFQLEDALETQKKKLDGPMSDQKTDNSNNIEDLRDPRFFTSKIDDDLVGEDVQSSVLKGGMSISEIDSGKNSINQPASTPVEHYFEANLENQKQKIPAIKVENQETREIMLQSTLDENLSSLQNQQQLIVHSPLSDGQSFDFNRIQTGAHSLSSTNSDMTRTIRIANRDILESPPNLISPQNINFELQKAVKLAPELVNLGDEMTDFILLHLLREIKEEMPILVTRPGLVNQQKIPPHIKFFDKKGVKTDLFAIEKYVDEVLEEVKHNRAEFMQEINKPFVKDNLELLFNMQNSEIGTYDHFQSHLPSVLSLDLYLKLEKRRKESRENPAIVAATGNPDGGFDFDRVTDQELRQDGVNKNFLAECQHIHNKVLFDCLNESLQQFRPFGKDGHPTVWNNLGRKLKPTEDFTLEEMFEITKHDIFRMALMQSGTLPRRDFIINNNFEEELFAEIREKKLAGLLCREIVETEPSWLKWDFEEAQTKIDIADMVLESLVTETIEFLNSKNPKSQAQMNFEEIQQMLKSR